MEHNTDRPYVSDKSEKAQLPPTSDSSINCECLSCIGVHSKLNAYHDLVFQRFGGFEYFVL